MSQKPCDILILCSCGLVIFSGTRGLTNDPAVNLSSSFTKFGAFVLKVLRPPVMQCEALSLSVNYNKLVIMTFLLIIIISFSGISIEIKHNVLWRASSIITAPPEIQRL